MVLSRPCDFFVVGSSVPVVAMNMIDTLIIGPRSGRFFHLIVQEKKICVILLALNNNCEC